MKKIFLLLTFVIVLGISEKVVAQSNTTSIQYVYSETTPTALQELQQLVQSDKELYVSCLARIKKLELEGKVILSTKEFLPIKERIDDFSSLSNIYSEDNKELLAYTSNAKQKYIVVTDVLKMLK